MAKKSAIIIGAGIGGISTAIHLAKSGYKVQIFEKNGSPGGRCGNISIDGHRFDIGATLFMIPDIYKETFEIFGKDVEQELDLIRMEPAYKIKFSTGEEIVLSSDLTKIKEQLERIESGSYNNFLKYLHKSINAYKLSMKNILDKNYFSMFDFFNLKNVLLLRKINAFKNHYKLTKRYFKSEILRTAFTYQNIYVGQNPFKSSGVFAMLPFLEISEGVFFPKGGMYQIIEKLCGIANDLGVEFNFNCRVKSITKEKKKVTGIILDTGNYFNADVVVSNADLPYTYSDLLVDKKSEKRLEKLNYACSAIVFHWGIDKDYMELKQHTIFISGNYKENIEAIFDGNILLDDPSFYVHSPVKSDHTAAPEGHDSITVIVPVGNLKDNEEADWKTLKEKAKVSVIRRLTKEGLSDFLEHIKFEACYTPATWKALFNLSYGSTFGSLGHNILQMGYFRPSNKHKKLKNMYFVGGSTHPASGVPMALISAKLTSEKILNYSK